MSSFHVKEILKESYIFLFDNAETFIKKTGLVLAFFFTGSLLYELFVDSMVYQGTAVAGSFLKQLLQGAATPWQLFWFILQFATMTLFGFMIITNMLRAKLNKDFNDPGILGVHWHRDVTVIAFAAIVPFAITMIAIFLCWPMIWFYAAGQGAAFITVLLLTLLLIAGIGGGLYLLGRLFLLMPICFAAKDISKNQIMQAWEMTNGKLGNIYLAIAGMVLPIAVSAFVINMFIYVIFAGVGLNYLAFILSSIVTALSGLYNVMALSVLQASLYQRLR